MMISVSANLPDRLEWICNEHQGQDGIEILFTPPQPEDKIDALRYVARVLQQNEVRWLHHGDDIADDWLLDLDRFKDEFKSRLPLLQHWKWASGSQPVTPVYDPRFHPRDKGMFVSGRVSFTVKRSQIVRGRVDVYFPELDEPLRRFYEVHGDSRCCFLMMSFRTTKSHKHIVDTITGACSHLHVEVLRSDYRSYHKELLANVRTYMHGCAFGIAVFEKIGKKNGANEFNPNVALEVGYMMALGKPVLILKANNLGAHLPVDIIGHLYKSFSARRPRETIPSVLEEWLRQRADVGQSSTPDRK